MSKTFCEVRKCVYNSNPPSTKYNKPKPRCVLSFKHVDDTGKCIDLYIKPRKGDPITFKATRRIPRKISISFLTHKKP